MAEGRNDLSAQPKYGNFGREHHVQTPPLRPLLLSFPPYCLSKPCVHLWLLLFTCLYITRFTLLFNRDFLSLISRLISSHVWGMLEQTSCLHDQPFKVMHFQWWHAISCSVYDKGQPLFTLNSESHSSTTPRSEPSIFIRGPPLGCLVDR